MSTLLSSYVEQIQTTFETMRRRGLVAYDAAARGAVYLEKMRRDLPKQINDLQKNELLKKAYDDIFAWEHLDSNDKSRRNNLQELYFGITILAVAMCAGETTGVLWSASIIPSVFDPFVELILIASLFVYAYLHLNECKAYDAIERRSWMFVFVFATCLLIGDLTGACILSTNPSLFFIPPLLLALLVDVEFVSTSFYSSRQCVLATVIGGGFLIAQSLAIFCGMLTFAGVLVNFIHLLLISVHFQVMEPRIDDERFGKNESQLLYVLGVLLIQLPLALIFGSA